MERPFFYMIIDDDKINNMVCEAIIKKIHKESDVKSFLRAEDALIYIQHPTHLCPDVILLDINMPEMDGWEFLEKYLQLPKKEDLIFILTSSINHKDIIRSQSYDRIKGYIAKPLTSEKLNKVFEAVHQQW